MHLSGAGCELGWYELVEARVQSVGVVVDPPFFDDLAGLKAVVYLAGIDQLLALAPAEIDAIPFFAV